MIFQSLAARGIATTRNAKVKIARWALLCVAVTAGAAALDAVPARAATLNVPGTYATIQLAITAANSGDTIAVAAGTYTETGQIVISKNLTIAGANKVTTIIKPSADTGTSGDSRGWFVVSDGITFNLQGVTLNGTGRKIYQAVRHKGVGNISDCNFTNIAYEQSGPAYEGIAVAVHSSGQVNVTNCAFTAIGRVGVAAYDTFPQPSTGPTGTYSGNTYTGKGAGDWLDYAFLIQGGAHVTISNNTITNCLGVATSDGSGSSGIAVWDDPSTIATLTGNTLTNNNVGLAIAIWNGGTTAPAVSVGAGNTFNGGNISVDFENIGILSNGSYVPGPNPAVTFGTSTFKAPTSYALYLDDDVAVGIQYGIGSTVFRDAGGTEITDIIVKETMIYDLNDAPNRGQFTWGSQDTVVQPVRPVNVKIPVGTSTVTKRVRVLVRNADVMSSSVSGRGNLAQLSAASDCPAGTIVGVPTFGILTASDPGTVWMLDGSTKVATLTLSITSANFTTFNHYAPTRCTITLTGTAYPAGAFVDPTPYNNVVTVELNVTDLNDVEQTTRHETVVASISPLKVTLISPTTLKTRKLKVKVTNADYLPTSESPGHTITVNVNPGDCPPGLLSVVDFDSATAGNQNSITVAGGASKTGRLTLTFNPASFLTVNSKSPNRCVATLTAVGPTDPDPSPSNNATKLIVDVTDRSDL